MWLWRNYNDSIAEFFLLIKLFLNDIDMENLLREQNKLAKECNISITESNEMPDFEREIHVNFLIKDKKEEQEALSK